MLNVGIVGLGLTGTAIARYLLDSRPDMRVVLAGTGPDSDKAGQDLGLLLGLRPCKVPVVAAEELPAALLKTRPQAIIDFSTPEATLGLLRYYARIGCGVVVGTTGFTDVQLKQLRNAPGTYKFGLMYAPNITRGVNVLMLVSRLLADYLPGYDIEITERHHRKKKDAPSGTAMKMAAQMQQARSEGTVIHGRKGLCPRTDSEIGVHSIRGGGIVGVHEVLFAGEHDEIVITHRSESRTAFAAGAAEAAEWISQRRGYFTMEDMIMHGEVKQMISTDLNPIPVTSPIG